MNGKLHQPQLKYFQTSLGTGRKFQPRNECKDETKSSRKSAPKCHGARQMGQGNRFIEVYSSPLGSTVKTNHGTKDNGVKLLETAVSTLRGGVLQGANGDHKNHKGEPCKESNRSG